MPNRAMDDTSSLMASMEGELSTRLGSVSPSISQRIFGLWTDRFFFLVVLPLFQTDEIFMDMLLLQGRKICARVIPGHTTEKPESITMRDAFSREWHE